MKSKLLSYFFKYSKGGIRSRTFAIIAGIPYSTTTATKADPNQLSRGGHDPKRSTTADSIP